MHQETPITDTLYYIGGSDRRNRLFENAYPIPEGMSYNSYLLMGEKTILFDCVDRSVEELFFENLEYTLQGRSLDYLVITHMEPDHAATIGDLVARYPGIKIIGNAKIFTLLGQFFSFSLEERKVEVKDNDTLTLGEHTLRFLFAPMVHWPEVMMVYHEALGTLFSADAFGSFGALSGNIFAQEVNFEEEWLSEARRYYANIVGKFGPQVLNVLKKVSGLKIDQICPLHGPVFRDPEQIAWYVDKYQHWASYTPEDKEAVIFSGSVYGNTENTANLLATELAKRGLRHTKVIDISSHDVSYLLGEAFRAKALVFAASSYNGGLFTAMEDFLNDLKAHNFQNRNVFIIENGSWAPTAGKAMREHLEGLKNVSITGDIISIRSRLTQTQVEQIQKMAEDIVKECKES